MKGLFRNILAVLAAVLAGGLVIMLLQALNAKFYPPPPGMNFNDAAAVKQYASTIPAGAFLMVLLSYLAGFTLAVFLSIRFSATVPERQGLLTSMFFGAASVLNLLSLPHPMWFWVANLAVLMVATWVGGILARQKEPARA